MQIRPFVLAFFFHIFTFQIIHKQMSKLPMKNFVGKSFYILLFLLSSISAFSQSVERYAFVSGAGFSSTQNPSVQSSIGELMIQSYFGVSDVLTQGFVQSDQAIITSSSSSNSCFTIAVFPNPAIEKLHLDISKRCKTEILIEVISIYGVKKSIVLNSVKTEYKEEYDLFLDEFVSGVYFLKVSSIDMGSAQIYKFLKL